MKTEALALGFKHVESGAARPLELSRPRPGPGRRAQAAAPPGDHRRRGPGRPARGLTAAAPVSVDFDPVRLGPRRRRIDPVIVGVIGVVVAIAVAAIKPWDQRALRARVAGAGRRGGRAEPRRDPGADGRSIDRHPGAIGDPSRLAGRRLGRHAPRRLGRPRDHRRSTAVQAGGRLAVSRAVEPRDPIGRRGHRDRRPLSRPGVDARVHQSARREAARRPDLAGPPPGLPRMDRCGADRHPARGGLAAVRPAADGSRGAWPRGTRVATGSTSWSPTASIACPCSSRTRMVSSRRSTPGRRPDRRRPS